jgi:hypothetical protein
VLAFEAETRPLRQIQLNYYRDLAASQLMSRQALIRMRFSHQGHKRALNCWLKTSQNLLPKVKLNSANVKHGIELQWQDQAGSHRIRMVGNKK